MGRIYTARFGTYAGRDALDVSRAGGDPVGVLFAPSWAILAPAIELRRSHSETDETFAEYAELYRAEMALSAQAHVEAWAALLAREAVTLLCFCPNAARCHRTVLASILAEKGARAMGERQRSLFAF